MPHGPFIDFGQKITRRRQALGLTLTKAAEFLEVKRPMLSRWENGHEIPREKNYQKLLERGLLPREEQGSSVQLVLPYDQPGTLEVTVRRKTAETVQLEVRAKGFAS